MSGFWHDHPWLGGLLGDGVTANHLGASATIRQMLVVEAAYARALGAAGRVPADVADRASKAILAFEPDPDDLRASTASDGVVVPGIVRQLKSILPNELHQALHVGLTSQDVVDTALMLSLQPVLSTFADKLDSLVVALGQLDERFGSQTIMGRTRMQAAIEIKASHRIAAWRNPMIAQAADLENIAGSLRVIQFGGPVGDRTSFGEDAAALAEHLATELGLADPNRGWHTDRKRFVDFANWMSATTAALGKFGTDIALMSLQGVDEVSLSSGGLSSAMEHKCNPINAELLAALARWNAALVGGIHQSQLHEQERSGSAWMMEWMVLPQMVEATSRSIETGNELCLQIDRIGCTG